MNICSIGFLTVFALAGAIVFLLPKGLPRQILLAVWNVAFLATWIPDRVAWIVLAVFLLSGYVVAWAARSMVNLGARKALLTVYFLLLLTSFVVLKKYDIISRLLPQSFLTYWVGIVGLSYMLFRQIHFVVDSAEGQVENPSLWTYINYQISVFTILAGPIDRYQNFSPEWQSLEPVLPDQHARLTAIFRILMGLLKVTVVAALLLYVANKCIEHQLYIRRPRDAGRFAMLFYCYPAYIYFNFSGYCDVAIGSALFFGMRLPENFNHPYLSRNMIDFWTRFHITLTNWIRDYVFNPLYKSLLMRWPKWSRSAAYTSYFIALFLAGLWHGSTSNWVVYGLMHGAGVSTTKWWEERIIKKRGRPGLREYLKNPRIRVAATIITFNFACSTFLFFPPGLHERVMFLRRFLFENPTAMVMMTAGPVGHAHGPAFVRLPILSQIVSVI